MKMFLDMVRFRSFNKNAFCKALQELVPEIKSEDLEVGGAGVRAQAMSYDGKLCQDFVFETQDRVLHVINAPSPGATASLAIGDEIVRRVRQMLKN